MSPKALFRRCAFAAALSLLAVASAGAAQLYKWVDERGIVNYSNQPPKDAKSAEQVKHVDDRVSVYTPDPALQRDIQAERERARRAEQEAARAPTQPAVVALGAPTPAPSSAPPVFVQDEIFPYPYYGPARHFRRWRSHRPVPQIELPPGATAGLVTGPNAVQPGLSSQGTRYTPRPPDRPAPLVPR